MHRAAHLLNNEEEREGWALRREYRALLAEMVREQQMLGDLRGAIPHFLKVTKSYWTGLFRCYEAPGIPHTNNELEQCFGSARYHERRTTGRKAASPALVVRGSVRLVAAVATRAHPLEAAELRPRDVAAWRGLRGALEERHATRRAQLRFRRDPDRYLRNLEAQLLKPSLPS